MRQIIRVLLSSIFLFTVLASIFAQNNKVEVAIIGFYNVENLFDTIDDPITIDEEFLPDGRYKWNSEKYLHKLEQLSFAISQIGKNVNNIGPTVLGLCEIENRLVIEDLIKQPLLKDLNYGIVHYDSPDRRGVDVGMIYQKDRFKVIGSSSHKVISADTNFLTRDQLLVHGLLDGEEMYFIVNHYPSKRGGEKRSLQKRIEAAELTRSLYDSLYALNPEVKMIIMGDLNDNPDAIPLSKTLQAKGKISDVKPGELYNAMFPLYRNGIGSYAWRDTWSMLDNFILSYALLETEDNKNENKGYQLYAAKVMNDSFLIQKSGKFKGYPFRSNAGANYIGGYSDHFPVYLILSRKPKQ